MLKKVLLFNNENNVSSTISIKEFKKMRYLLPECISYKYI